MNDPIKSFYRFLLSRSPVFKPDIKGRIEECIRMNNRGLPDLFARKNQVYDFLTKYGAKDE